MFYLCSEAKKLELVRNWLKRPPRALPKCYLDWVKQLPEDEKKTLRELRKIMCSLMINILILVNFFFYRG
jgi:hypothetical protein